MLAESESSASTATLRGFQMTASTRSQFTPSLKVELCFPDYKT